MGSVLKRLWTIRPLRMSIGFVLLMLVLFRVLAHIPVPGIDVSVLRGVLAGNVFLGLLNIFSGGTLENFSVVALGVAPYITSSIIFQLLAMVVPSLHRLQRDEGEAGRQKVNMWTRWATVPLAVVQAYGFIALISQTTQRGQLLLTGSDLFIAMLVLAAGTIFMMWIGELISLKGIGNGMSILIFSGIISGLPRGLQQLFTTFDQSKLVNLVIFALLAAVTIVAVVIVSEATRNIPVHYARHFAGNRLTGGVNTHLPLKLIMAGVIPIIFAISVIIFPTTLAQFFIRAKTPLLVSAAESVIRLFNTQWFYGAIYFVLVFFFTYFYTSVIFKPDEMAENLQKQGAFIPGVRPGKPTEEYLNQVMSRLLLVGGLFLAVIAVLPTIVQPLTGSQNLVIGGTSILIVVSVVVDIVKQTEAQLVSYEYEQM
ncbi:MAG: preprotein translocase subunit SecY [Patescibacteria group bacterium]